ncbi:hypothetical protein SASPL_104761 [Salvia splendens]|uniref:Uncharacterized protein n=1 Tax=Salvia splendens TaxID=180675 RepID=A0A8X9A9D5_SALSN|nr:hypothetical protein SASPL_104761 [Salvia splendens]
MKCKILASGQKSAIYTLPKPNQSTEARISFSSQVSSARVAIKGSCGLNRAQIQARIEASSAVTAESLYEVLGIGESVSSVSDIKKRTRKWPESTIRTFRNRSEWTRTVGDLLW